MCERQAVARSMRIQYSNVSILLVSLLSSASGSLRTTLSFFLKCLTLVQSVATANHYKTRIAELKENNLGLKDRHCKQLLRTMDTVNVYSCHE